MQVLFRSSLESPSSKGLGIIPSGIGLFSNADKSVPHMGWNTVEPPESSVLFRGIEQERFYFVHSFGVLKWEFEQNSEHMLPPQVTWSRHGSPFIAAVENGALSATQFHPEKSGQAGLQLLRNWLETLPRTGRLDAALAERDAQTAGQEEIDA